MPEMEKADFKFPDEIDQESKGKPVEAEDVEIEIEVEDDTPEGDRGRPPLPETLKEELEKDELDGYDEAVKVKLKQMKKVWHDERREKERIARENAEAVSMLQRLMDENKKYRDLIQTGSKEYASTLENAANLEVEAAKRAYKEAYEAGDSDRVVDAQQALQAANLKLVQAKNFKAPALQEPETEVQIPQSERSAADPKLTAWQKRNPWYGQLGYEDLTAYALGWHEKVRRQGSVVIGSDTYYDELDKVVRKRFPEYFEDSQSTEEPEEKVVKAKAEPAPTKPSTVVAPAIRSTSAKKVKLKQSTLDMLRKIGVTPEQYVREQQKLESRNG